MTEQRTPEYNQKPAPRPVNDIDLQAQLIDPFTSSDYVNQSFANKFREYEYFETDGKISAVITKDLWGILQIYNRDLRLGNLNKEESFYVRYHLDLCTDVMITLGEDFKEPALILLTRALTITETSQSKGGFLRKLINTFFSENKSSIEEKPAKRNFLGMGKKVEG